ncbi:hypothetical protein SRHO_G00317770 [Serrasalmus rhombeus]
MIIFRSSTQVIPLEKGRTEYEIAGRTLQPNSDYVVTAGVSTDYNQNLRMKRELWDTYPTPKITSSFKNQIDILLPFENESSPIHVEHSSLELIGNKTCSTSQADVSREHHNHQSIRSSVDSAAGGHAQVHSGSVGQDKVTVNATVNKMETSMSYSALENQSRATVTVNSTSGTGQDSRNSSELLSFTNKCYFDAGFSLLTDSPTLLRKRIYSLLRITLTHPSVTDAFWNHILTVPPFCTSLNQKKMHL